MIRIRGIELPVGFTPEDIKKALSRALGAAAGADFEYRLTHCSLDCRGRRPPRRICEFAVECKDEKRAYENARKNGYQCEYPFVPKRYAFPASVKTPVRPVVVGFGPAGIFCALMLAENGVPPLVIERGGDIDARERSIAGFIRTAVLDTECNIQFGEGGAGAFSDGKLTTLIKDKDARCAYILKRLVEFGAPEDILYASHPHIGTDLLRGVIKNIRNHIIRLGGIFRFSECVKELVLAEGRVAGVRLKSGGLAETDTVFLCIGHSARDTFRSLASAGVRMERKPFSVGVRIEHLQKAINAARYREYAYDTRLPAAEYKAAVHTKSGRTLYTFCMCPGGYVSAATSEHNAVVTNGMSMRERDGKNANSALLVSVEPNDLNSDDLFAGVEFQQKLERTAYELGGGAYKAPAQTYADFAQGAPTRTFGSVEPTYPLGVTGCCLKDVLPPFVRQALAQGIPMIDKLIPGFASPDAVLTAVESRSTCPLRIVRDPQTLQASARGLYPVGEGAGYAGGIMSAAADGIKAAEAYAKEKGVLNDA